MSASVGGVAADIEKKKPLKGAVQTLRHHVLHLTPSWFSVCMGTGIVSILLHELPFPVAALRWIGVAIWLLNVLIFVLLFLATAARYIIWPSVLVVMLKHPAQSLFLGTLPMGFSTIINMVVFAGVPAFGNHFAMLAWALWWIDVFLTLVIGLGVPFMMFSNRHEHSLQGLNAVWLQPFVAAVVTAATGGIVANVLPPEQARLTIVLSYIILGTGLPVALLLMGLYVLRLAVHASPPSDAIVSVFLPIGPCGQGAFAFLKLSQVVRKLAYETPSAGGILPLSTLGVAEAQIAASAIYGVSLVVAFLLWGLGLFWLVIAIGTIVDVARKEKVRFNMGFWAFTFPLGVFTTATNNLGLELDSKAFKVVGCAFTALVSLLWVFIASMTVIRAFQGTMFVAPCLSPFGGEPPPPPGSKQIGNAAPIENI